MPLPERVKAAALAAVIVLAAAGLLVAAQAFHPEAPVLSAGISVSMRIEGAGWTIGYASNDTRNNTAFLFLMEASRALHFDVQWTNWSPPYSAVFIDAVNGSHNGDGDRWWQFWVDGVYADTAADLAILHGGDSVRWAFVPSAGR